MFVFFLDLPTSSNLLNLIQDSIISDYEKGQRDLNQLFKCTNATFAESYYQEYEFSELILFSTSLISENFDKDAAWNIGSDNDINHGDNATAEATRNN